MPLILGTNSIKGGYEVDNSLRFDDGSSNYLSRTPSSASNRRTWTWSSWIKLGAVTGDRCIFSASTDASNRNALNVADEGYIIFDYEVSGDRYLVSSQDAKYRDPSAWYHIVLAVDTTQSTEANRVRIYVNGSEITLTEVVNGYPSQNTDMFVNNNIGHAIGKQNWGTAYFDGYMTEITFIDGQQLTPTSFGEFDSDSPTIWKPIDVSGLTFGTNGFYLDFEKDESNALFADRSSNPKTVTVAGNVHHSVDQAKFGDTSIEFDGSGDKLTLADTADFDFGTGDFTIEFFAYMSNQSDTYHTIINDPGTNHFRVNLGTTAATPKLTFYSATWDAHTEGTTDLGNEAWHHCAVVRESGTLNIYVDGSREAQRANSTNDLDIGALTIGEYNGGAKAYTGYLDEIRISNTARYTGTSYTVPTASFTSDSNTKLLIQSNASNRLGADVSGQGNHFLTDSGFTSQSQSTDTCTNNFATYNSLQVQVGTANEPVFRDGNLTIHGSTTGSIHFHAPSTIGVTQGKWYAEFKGGSASNENGLVGVTYNPGEDAKNDDYPGQQSHSYAYFVNGNKYTGDNGTSYGNAWTTDIIGVALDLDNHKLYFSKNGVFQNSGDPTSGSTGTGSAFSLTTGQTYFFATGDGNATYVNPFEANFGNPTFTISSGNSDANGHGNFEYAVPSGYFALCTKNLAEFG